ncbi:zinc finger protein RFP [Alligator mississippiensis]|uniref:zinc finger protein RFP n=1 Tax=Alligator mississippiensis TaxID=8496 RepID=UPI00287750B6|nr:zinc finger protein RFP [Alligator mississippiensis]
MPDIIVQEKHQAHLKTLRERREDLLELKQSGERKTQEYLDIRKTLSRCDKGEIPQPVPISSELERRLQDFCQTTCALTETGRKFKDTLPSVLEKRSGDVPQPYTKVMVTLDPDTAHPKLILSADKRSVTLGGRRQDLPDNPERFDFESFVLGHEELTWGRHYWEVEVDMEESDGWALGIARETVRRKGEINISPKEGIWGVLHWWGNQIQALTAPTSTCVHLPQEPSRVRVCLDYAEGLVSFFSANAETPIFTFPPASFAGDRIRPWFCLRLQPMLCCKFDSGQLRMCP